MKAIFSVLGLLIVVAVIGVLAKKQLSAGVAPAAVPGMPAQSGAAPATPQQQVQQFKSAVEGAMQQAAPARDESK